MNKKISINTKNTKTNSNIKLIMYSTLIISLIIISSSSIYALGVAPSKKIIEYDTEEHSITVRIINNEAKDMTLRISAGGPLASAVTIINPIIIIKSDESEKEFTYIVKMPPDVTPGPKSIFISIEEVNDASNTNSLSGLLTVSHQLQINVPYTGLYAEGYLSIASTNNNEETIAAVNIVNKGTENIQLISGTLNIRDLNGEIIYSKKIQEYKDLFPGTSIKIEESFNIGKSGKYVVEYNINYDDKIIVVNKEFYTGEYSLVITGASVKNFQLGTIAKLDVDVSNNWNVPYDNVYGEIIVTDLNGTIVGRANTTQITISPSTGIFTVYWDTTNIKTGYYTINLKLYTGDKVITQTYPSMINNNEIIIGALKETKTKNNYTVAVVLIIVAVILLWMLFERRNKKIYK
jgi:hypothetical protein